MTIFSLGKEAMSDEHYINLLFFTPSSSRRLSFSYARKSRFKGDVYKNNGWGAMTWRMLGRSVAIGILLCFEYATYFRFRYVQQN